MQRVAERTDMHKYMHIHDEHGYWIVLDSRVTDVLCAPHGASSLCLSLCLSLSVCLSVSLSLSLSLSLSVSLSLSL